MKRRNRPVLATLSVAFLAAVAAMAAATPAQAATSSADTPTTVTITYNLGGSVTLSPATVTSGDSVVFANRDVAGSLTVTLTGNPTQSVSPLGQSSPVQVTAGQYEYGITDKMLVTGITTGQASGSFTAVAAPAPSTSTGTGGNPAPVNSPPAGGIGSGGIGTGGNSTPTSSAAGAAPGNAAAPAVPGVPPASAGAQEPAPQLLYPGGVVGSIAPGATVDGLVPAPEVAPYATSTAPDGQVTTLYSTHTPTASPSPVAALGGGGSGGSGRGLGLPAAVTAVILIGLLVTLFRLLLTHPAARAVARRH